MVRLFWRTALLLFASSIFVTIVYRWINPPLTPLMVSRALSGSSIHKRWVPIEDISPNLIQAAVAAEDNNFLGHHGFDLVAISNAIDEHRRGRKQRGASTISQQTAKNVFLWSGRSWIRKGLEVYFTFLIETFWSKERIMEVYLNVIETGDGVYGVEQAAQTYFNTSAKRLSTRKSALITAAYPNPRQRDPGHPTSYLNRRAGHIMHLMNLVGPVKFDDASIDKAQKRFDAYNKKGAKKSKKKK